MPAKNQKKQKKRQPKLEWERLGANDYRLRSFSDRTVAGCLAYSVVATVTFNPWLEFEHTFEWSVLTKDWADQPVVISHMGGSAMKLEDAKRACEVAYRLLSEKS